MEPRSPPVEILMSCAGTLGSPLPDAMEWVTVTISALAEPIAILAPRASGAARPPVAPIKAPAPAEAAYA